MKSNKKRTTTRKRTSKKKKIGFTLIELLAVIIILGILLLVAIPSVTTYISDSRKSTYVVTAKEYINGSRNLVNKGKSDMFDLDTTYYIPISCIETESGGESPYGTFKDAYVLVSYNGDGFDYYWASTDSAKVGIYHTSESVLSEQDVVTNVTSIDTGIAMGSDSKVALIDASTCEVGERKNATSAYLPEDKRMTEGYTLEYTKLVYNFNGKKSYVKNRSGATEVINLEQAYNNFWVGVNNTYTMFLRYNDQNFVQRAEFKLNIPKVKDGSGNELRVTSWYYEQKINRTALPNQTWTCRGTASQTSVMCTPKETYTGTSYTTADPSNPQFVGYLYLYLDNGKYIKEDGSLRSYANFVYMNNGYYFPNCFGYGIHFRN